MDVRFSVQNGLKPDMAPMSEKCQKATCRTPSNDETDPAWRAGALFHNEREAGVFRVFLGGFLVWL